VLLRGDDATLSSVDDAQHPEAGGAALSADGNVLAFGDFTFLTSPYNNAADNAALIGNVADFLLGGTRTPALANYPFVFTSSEALIYPTAEVTLSPEMISAVGMLQASLRAARISLSLAEESPRDGNAIVLATYAAEDLKKLTAPFDVSVEEEGSVTLAKVGKFARTGNGLILFNENKKGVTLTLIADTPEDLVSLVNLLASGSLGGCVLQNNAAVCSVGFGSGGYFEDPSLQTTPEGEATPTPVVSG
jgi:hypothetical protein